jgi:hypothetical protein
MPSFSTLIRWLTIVDALIRAKAAPKPDRKRTPQAVVPAGSAKVHELVSGQHSQPSPLLVQSKSMQPSGTKRCTPEGSAIHEQIKKSAKSAGGS